MAGILVRDGDRSRSERAMAGVADVRSLLKKEPSHATILQNPFLRLHVIQLLMCWAKHADSTKYGRIRMARLRYAGQVHDRVVLKIRNGPLLCGCVLWVTDCNRSLCTSSLQRSGSGIAEEALGVKLDSKPNLICLAVSGAWPRAMELRLWQAS
ncbi:hypothetical protein BDV10DRAFT_179644 [Aspergillus recurvatus]